LGFPMGTISSISSSRHLSSAMVNFAPLLPFVMMRLDSARDDRAINTVTNDGGESMESWEGGRDSASSVHVAKAEKEGQHHLLIVPSSAMSSSPIPNVEKMLWRGAFMRLWFSLQIRKPRLTSPRGPPRLTNLRQKSQICNEFSDI
jgi:hypothetical protein